MDLQLQQLGDETVTLVEDLKKRLVDATLDATGQVSKELGDL